MTRHLFGAGPASWTFNNNGSGTPMVGGAVVQAFNAQTGGTQYVDLSLDLGGTLIVDHVTSSDASDGLQLGQIPPFYGPDDVYAMWLSADGGPRIYAVATNLGDDVATNAGAIAALQGQIDALGDSVGQPDGVAPLDSTGKLAAANRWTPQFSFANASDAVLSSPQTGDTIIYGSGSHWVIGRSTWNNLSLNSGYVTNTINTSAVPRYRKSADGRFVYLTGQISKASGSSVVADSTGPVVATLPAGYRPTRAQSLSLGSRLSTYTSIRADFVTNGDIRLFADPGYAVYWTALDGAVLVLD